MADTKGFSSKAIHSGFEKNDRHDAVVAPIFQSSTFEMVEDLSYHDIRYARMNNSPTHLALHEKLADLENGEAAMTFASGMAAISSALLAALSPGDHFLAQNCVYGGTVGFFNGHLKKIGVDYSLIDGFKPDTWKASLTEKTKLIYVESIANPDLTVVELEEVVRFAKDNDLITMIDNTFTSPYNFRPLDMGFDVSLHSATKYLNGHADVIAGAVISNQKFINKLKGVLVHFGASLDPLACFLLDRGIKTLPLRMRQHNENALKVAKFLKTHSLVSKVYYPGLEEDAQFDRANKFFDGCGGVVSFEIPESERRAQVFLDALSMIKVAPSLGGVETLAVLPAKSSHVGQSSEEFAKLGFDRNLIRISVGVEDAEDIINEIDNALKKAGEA